MTMGLTQKHYNHRPKLGLDDLNKLLDANFNEPGDTATIDPNDYALSIDELIAEGQKAGYTVAKAADNKHLEFS